MYNKTKTKNTTCIVKQKRKNKDGSYRLVIVGYLTARHEENGIDSHLDMLGYIIEAI